jgi:hypothetical protein
LKLQNLRRRQPKTKSLIKDLQKPIALITARNIVFVFLERGAVVAPNAVTV